MSHPKNKIDGMHTAHGLHLVICGNAVEKPEAKARRRWPYPVLVLVAICATVASYLR